MEKELIQLFKKVDGNHDQQMNKDELKERFENICFLAFKNPYSEILREKHFRNSFVNHNTYVIKFLGNFFR